MSSRLENDASVFIDEARSSETDFGSMSKGETKMWMFRVKKRLSERYEIEVEGFEEDYVVSLSSYGTGGDETKAEFVVDRKNDRVEVDVFVMQDGNVKVHDTWTE